jgi:lipopolysaccharide biosynthesis protein
VAAVVHMFHSELVDEIIDHVAVIPVPFDLLITNATDSQVDIDRGRMPHVADLTVLDVANRGRDLWPLVQLVNAGLLVPYDLVVKIHTKRSEWRGAHQQLGGTGAAWRTSLLSAVLGQRPNVEAIIAAFEREPDLGLVTGDGSVVGPEYWGADLDVTRTLMRRLGLAVDPMRLTFAAGSMYWIRGSVLLRLAGLRMTSADFEDEQGQIDGTTAHAVERVIGLLTADSGLRLVERSVLSIADPAAREASRLAPAPPGGPDAPAVVAFYLPQYHRIPENDAWWGDGFTDWVNVRNARPLYPGHAVPNLPGELGEYDVLWRDVRKAQAELAREHGVYGFCYYWYWFGGRRLLERPLELVLEDGEPDLPFCLCWANEPWTRRWDGRDRDVLMPQHHHRVGDLAIIDDLMPYFEDPRYIRIDGRPVLLVYRQGLMPDAAGFAADLRATAAHRGLPGLFLCNVLSIGDIEGCAPGFDAAVEFPPNGTLGRELRPKRLGADPSFRGHIYDYDSTVLTALALPTHSFPHFPGVMPRWDNTARKGVRAHIFHGSTPERFERWLQRAAWTTRRANPGAPLVFINSWNEWAEGAHLEPDATTGRRYLQALRRVVWAEGAVVSDAAPHTVLTTEFIELVPGFPAVGQGAQVPARDGVGWIETVGGHRLASAVASETGDSVTLQGWAYANSRSRRGAVAYLIFCQGESVWHAPIARRIRRPDVLRGMRGTTSRSRKLIRAIDRLPGFLADVALRIWSRDDARIGFVTRVRMADLPIGDWRIDIVETDSKGFRRTSTGFTLRRTGSPRDRTEGPAAAG